MPDDVPRNELRELLEPLARADGAVAAALLSRVLAHEVGNGLNPIGLQLELLRRRSAGDARVLEILDGLRESVQALGKTLDVVRAYAHDVAPPSDDDEERRRGIVALESALRGE